MPPLQDKRSYDDLARLARHTPEPYNFAEDSIDRHAFNGADGHRTALVADIGQGVVTRYTFLELAVYSNRLAHVLTKKGIGPGDIILLLMAPSGAAAITFLAALKIGAVAMPLPVSTSPDSLASIVNRLGVAALIGDLHCADLVSAAAEILPGLRFSAIAHAYRKNLPELWTSLISESEDYTPRATLLRDPAVLLPHPDMPAGALYTHGALRARAISASFVYRNFPTVGDVLWSATDWASENGWVDAVLPAWRAAVAVAALPLSQADMPGLIQRWGVRVTHLPPSGLPLFEAALAGQAVSLRALAAFGDFPADAQNLLLKHFGRNLISVLSHPVFGPLLVSSDSSGQALPQGALGLPPPGFALDVIDEKGRVLPAGEKGELAILATNAALPFQASECRNIHRIGAWLGLGLQVWRDLDGIFWPESSPTLPDLPKPATRRPPPASKPGHLQRRARRPLSKGAK